jgi:stress response protein YsnF
MEEVLVVQKQLILKEEVHIRKRRIETHQPQQVTLRREEAHIDRLKPNE